MRNDDIRDRLTERTSQRGAGKQYLGGLDTSTVFCPGLKKGMVLLEEKGHFCSRNYILRALSRAKLFYEGTLHKLWATHPMFEM